MIDDDTLLNPGLGWNDADQDFGGNLYSVKPRAYLNVVQEAHNVWVQAYYPLILSLSSVRFLDSL